MKPERLNDVIVVMFAMAFIGSSFFFYQSITLAEENNHIILDNMQKISGSLLCENGTVTTVPVEQTGMYTSVSGIIKIYVKGRDFNQSLNTFVHEWGHHVWYEDLDQVQRDYYCNLNFVENVTEYAGESCKENFAETFQYWYFNKTIPEPQKTWFENHMELVGE